MPYTIEAKALGPTAIEVITKYENLRSYLQGNFATIVNFLTSIDLVFTSGNEVLHDRTSQWVVSTNRKSDMAESISKIEAYAKKHGFIGIVSTLEYLLMGCGIEIENDNVTILSRRSNDELMQKLNQNRNDGIMCDLKIIVGDETFQAHKAVVATLSNYFADSYSESKASIQVDGVETTVFANILNYLYTGRLEISENDFPALKAASTLLNIECLTTAVCMYSELQKYKNQKKTKKLSVPLVVVTKHEIAEQTDAFPQPKASNAEDATDSALAQDILIKPKIEIVTPSRRGKRKIKRNPKYEDYDVVEVSYHSDDALNNQSQLSEEEEGSFSGKVPTCGICGKQFVMMKYLRRHMERHTNTPSRPCPLCGFEFESKKLLDEHFLLQHSTDMVQYKCGIENCNEMFETFNDLREHKDEKHANTTVAIISEHGEEILDESGQDELDDKEMITIAGKPAPPIKRIVFGKRMMTGLIHTSSKKRRGDIPCSVCEQVFSTQNQLTKHMARHAGGRQYLCAICDMSFINLNQLDRHVVDHMEKNELFTKGIEMGEAGEFRCDECLKTMQTLEQVIKHKMIHSEQKPFKCGSCNETFTQVESLRKHVRSEHHGQKRSKLNMTATYYYDREMVQCPECHKTMQRKSLKDHMFIHCDDTTMLPANWQKHKCLTCNKHFRSRGHLERHQRLHTGERPFMCDICGKGFATADFVQSHIKKTHIEASFFCDVCGKGCKTEGALKAHRFTHENILPHQCDECGKTFRSKGTLTFHKRLHAFEQQCKVCQQKLPPSQMARHMLLHKNGIEKFVCELCDKVFLTKDGRSRHINTVHSGIRHQCKQCDKSYSSIKILRNHMKIHTGIGLHKCEVCNKAFGTGSMLKKHALIHTGRKDYTCKVCGRGFAQPKNCISHERACLLKQKGLEQGRNRGVGFDSSHQEMLIQMDEERKQILFAEVGEEEEGADAKHIITFNPADGNEDIEEGAGQEMDAEYYQTNQEEVNVGVNQSESNIELTVETETFSEAENAREIENTEVYEDNMVEFGNEINISESNNHEEQIRPEKYYEEKV